MQRKVSAEKSLLLTVGGLLLFGLIMIYDATAVYSQDTFGIATRFVLLQLAWVLLGSLGLLFFYKYDYKKLYKIALIMFGIALLCLSILALVGILPCTSAFIFAPCVNGANRWLYINPNPLPKVPVMGVLGFQPGEFAKLAVILYLSVLLNNKAKKATKTAFWTYFVLSGFVSLLILLQPNMSTAVLVFLICTLIYVVSGFELKPFVYVMPTLGLISGILMFLSPYRRERLITFLGGKGTDEIGYHIKQILISLGSGGLFGLGFGQSKQKFQYLPETSADSIFAIIGEELGFIGTTLVILAFSYLIYKGFTIAKNAPDLLGRLLATGITSWIGLQFFVNIAAMTKLIPLTGVPLPLISYGGSSLVFSLMGIGILANIAKNS